MQAAAAFVLVLLPVWAAAEHCEEIDLQGKPFEPGSLIVCRNGKDVRKSTDPTSCPAGWKIWAPEKKSDWQTIKELNLHNVKNPDFLVDVTRPANGCGGCRAPMNSKEPTQAEWRTSNGAPWWLRDSRFGEPNGDYTANCYLRFWNTHDPNNIGFNDAWCRYHSRDYLCTPMSKIDCTEPQYADAITGPCASQPAIFRHSNCSSGLCDAGSKILTFSADTTIEKCKEICDEGRKFVMPTNGLQEDWFFFRQNGRYHDVLNRKPDFQRVVTTGINYRSTGHAWPGVPGNRRDHYYIRWTGSIIIKTGGRYAFWTKSDDGSRVWINGKQVVDNPGWHGMRSRGSWQNIGSGSHEFAAEYFEGGGGAGMEFDYQGPDTNNRRIRVPGSAFSSGGSEPQLPGIFNTRGPCMAYSISPDSDCILYTACQSVASGSLDSTCAASLNFLEKNTSNYKTCNLPPVPTPAPTPKPTPAPPTPAPPNGWLGCYTDNGRRDLKHGPRRYGYTVSTCRKYAKDHSKKYFALQHNGWCSTDNTYATPSNQYRKRGDHECGAKCRGETAGDAVLRCGGGWRNAMYKADPSSS